VLPQFPGALATGKRAAVLTHQGVIAFGQFQDKFMGSGQLRRLDNALHGHTRISKRNVCPHGTAKQKVLLEHNANLTTQPGRIHLGDINTINEHAPTVWNTEALNKLDQDAFARTGAADNAWVTYVVSTAYLLA